MALKDWKKKDKYSYYNDKTTQTIMVYWYVAVPDITVLLFDRKRKIVAKHLGTFRKKSRALEFAKKYMRKH